MKYEWDEVAGSKVSSLAILKSGLRMLRLIGEVRFGWQTKEATAAGKGILAGTVIGGSLMGEATVGKAA